MSVLVRHPSGNIPSGPFEVVIEHDDLRTVCRNSVPDDLQVDVPCTTTVVQDAAVPNDGSPDASIARSPYTIFLDIDFNCRGAQTGSGAVSTCDATGTSYQELLLVVDRDTAPPESVRITARAADGLVSEQTIEPRYVPFPVNGLGCPGACSQGTGTFQMR